MAANERPQRPKLPYGELIGKYKVIKCVGQGGYGDIYYVTSPTDQFPTALKFEMKNARKQALKREYEYLKKVQGSIKFPRAIDFVEEESYRYIVMEMLGPSVSNLRRSCTAGKFGLFTTLQVAQMMLSIIEELHERGLIHRDIKPGNFLLRPSSNVFLCLVDFGLSKIYIDPETQEVLGPVEHPGFKGTLKYASPYAHYGEDQGRRDDLFSWFYSVAELYTGKLPWANVQGKTHILKAKRRFRKSEYFQIYPAEFYDVLRYIEHLRFSEKPDYEYLNSIIEGMYSTYCINQENPLDWENLSEEATKKISIFPLKRTDNLVPFSIEEILLQDEIERKIHLKKKKEKEKKEEKQKEQEKEVYNNMKVQTNENARKRNQASCACLLI